MPSWKTLAVMAVVGLIAVAVVFRVPQVAKLVLPQPKPAA